MAITREKKEELLGSVKDIVSKAPSAVFVNFHGLSVIDTTALRKSLRDEGVSYFVTKKTIINKALDEGGIKGDKPTLEGELALTYGDDLVAPARGIHEFAKDHEGTLTILGGVFEGEYKNRDEMMEIATIPPTDVLRGMFVNVINSPIQSLALVLDQIAQKKA